MPDHFSKNLVLCTLHFTADSFTNKAQFNTGFSERLKLNDDALSTILNLTVTSHQMCYCYYVVTIALSVIKDSLICTKDLCIFNLKHSTVHLCRM